jgi:Do/DeqQ family serine protease
MKTKEWMKVGIVAVLSGIVAVALYAWITPKPYQGLNERQQAYPARYAAFANIAEGSSPVDFTGPAALALPAVVHIKTVVENKQASGNVPPGFDMFRDFFGGRPEFRQGPREGSGSGVIITADGYIVTNNHVIDDADKVTVVLDDKRTYTGTVIGTDPSTDLALVKITEKNLPFLKVANSDDVKVGQWVLAVGNPFELTGTVTAGIVSAKGRGIGINRDSLRIESFIQTDAAVNPGNSGGALINTKGELIGINTAIASNTGAYAGYSFAVPSAIVSKVVDDLMNFGEVQRGLLGIRIADVEDAKERLNFKTGLSQGVYVSEVNDGSAAADAGIKKDDIITKVDGREVKSGSELLEMIGRKRPGDKVVITLVRDGSEKQFNVTLKNKSGTTAAVKREVRASNSTLGANLQNLTAEEMKKLNLGGGAKVASLLPGRLRSAGVREGFIVTRVNDQEVKTAEDVTRIIQKRMDEKRSGAMLEGIYPDGKTALYAIGF